MQIDLLGQPLVILGSHKAAIDMLDRKTSIYSDRPRLTVGSLVGWNRLTALLPYGSRWRETRRLFTPALGSRASVVAFEPIMNVQVTRALPRMVRNPKGIVDEIYKCVICLSLQGTDCLHVHRTVAGTTLMIVYGYDLPESDNTFVDVLRTTMPQFSTGFMPGAHLVDVLPICMFRSPINVKRPLQSHTVQYVPSWVPGMQWKKQATTWKHDLNAQLELPYQYAKQEIVIAFVPLASICIESLT